MAVAVVQEFNLGDGASATARTIDMDAANGRAITAASSLVAWLAQPAQSNRTYTCSSDVDGAFTQLSVIVNNDYRVSMFYLDNLTGGDHVITMTANASTTFTFGVVEFSGTDTTDSKDVESSLIETVNSGSHPCAAAGAIDTVAGVGIVTVGITNAGTGAATKHADYTLAHTEDSSGPTWLAQYRVSAGALTDEDAIWTAAGTNRKGGSMMASFKPAAGGATPPTNPFIGPFGWPLRGPIA